ncbi:deoxynucleoside kinase [Bacillus toyonensis]|uniref:deoxynucleoside kinase n=1 Tax=Bacillus toyonensis TaxID=155322 RepID=UPI000BF0D094|nr:deoxynucleoside kinase [Bacillus toyonensis]PEL24344.1 deoxynucleoside kinase [Bacillus toyonensis]
MKLITVAGMIGVGKSSLTELIAERYNSLAKYEDIEQPVIHEWLSKWYMNTEEERTAQRVPIFTQMAFLVSRMNSLRDCMLDERQGFAVLDRSIYEDKLFAKLKYDLGEINESEWKLYCQLLDTMWKEVEMIPRKAPHLTIYVRASFETIMKRIWKRGREYETTELNESMKDWYRMLWEAYDDYMFNEYKFSRVLVIEGDEYDFVEDETDREKVMDLIHQALIEEGVIEEKPESIVGRKVSITAPFYFGGKYTEGTVTGYYTDGTPNGTKSLDVTVEGHPSQLRLYDGQYEFIEGESK